MSKKLEIEVTYARGDSDTYIDIESATFSPDYSIFEIRFKHDVTIFFNMNEVSQIRQEEIEEKENAST